MRCHVRRINNCCEGDDKIRVVSGLSILSSRTCLTGSSRQASWYLLAHLWQYFTSFYYLLIFLDLFLIFVHKYYSGTVDVNGCVYIP